MTKNIKAGQNRYRVLTTEEKTKLYRFFYDKHGKLHDGSGSYDKETETYSIGVPIRCNPKNSETMTKALEELLGKKVIANSY